MGRTAVLPAILFCITSTCFAQGVPCEKREPTELREMDKQRLEMVYCDLKSRSDANQEAIRSIEDFSFMEDAQRCADELLKAERVYRDRFGDDLPECGR